MDRLQEILDHKKKEIELLHEDYQPDIAAMQKPRPSFAQALDNKPYLSVIAEIKRQSPSAGELNTRVDPLKQADIYQKNGAAAISVLTDRKFFGGDISILKEVAENTTIPVLCKEFILDPFQIDQARENGASAVLLISDILDDTELMSLYHYARDMEMDVLLEAHHPENIERCVELRAPIIGINNRNLRTFEIDLDHSIRVAPLLPDFAIKLSLSAVNTAEDAQRLVLAGYQGILAGSSLMRSEDPGELLRTWTKIPL